MGKIERGILNGTGYEVWMSRRQDDFGDEVEPVSVDIVDGDHVVWARRSGISDQGYFDFHHIGCDHLGPVPRGQSEIQTMLGCQAVQQVLFEKAHEAAKEIFSMDELLPRFTYVSHGEVYLDEQGEELAGHFIWEALVKTIEEPEVCRGNIREGVHAKPIVKLMLGGVADKQIDLLADALQYQGLATYHDPLIAIAA